MSAKKAALESQLRSLQDQQDRLKTDSGLVWMLLLRGDLAMPQAVKDLQDQQETLRQERASLAARPELEKAWADLFDLNHVATTDERSAAFLRIYASQLRQRHPWDIAETMASTIENIATHVEQRAADPAPSAPPRSTTVREENTHGHGVHLGGINDYPPKGAPPRPEGWQTIETAPKDGTWIICLTQDGDVRRVSWGMSRNYGLQWCSEWSWFTPTHWMPLPAPPPVVPPTLEEKNDEKNVGS